MRFPAEVYIFEQQVRCEKQILGCASGVENGAIIPDSSLQAGARWDQNLPREAT
jgi:hypothetical protein